MRGASPERLPTRVAQKREELRRAREIEIFLDPKPFLGLVGEGNAIKRVIVELKLVDLSGEGSCVGRPWKVDTLFVSWR